MVTDALGIELVVNTLLHLGERVVEVSRDHVITRVWNREGGSLPPVPENFIGSKICQLPSDDILRKLEDHIEHDFLSGGTTSLNYNMADGKTTYSVRLMNCHPDKQYLLVLIGQIRRRPMEDAEAEKWKMALDATSDGMWETNVITGEVLVSDKWQSNFGYDASEIDTVDKWMAKVHPDDRAMVDEKMKQHFNEAKPSYESELRYLCKDGSYRWLLSRAKVVSRTPDGKVERLIGTHTDIDRNKRAEEKYAATAQLLAKLINNIHSAILVTDENWNVVFVNNEFHNMYVLDDRNEQPAHEVNMLDNLSLRKLAYKDPEYFYNRTIEIFNKQEIVLNEEWELVDGRFLCRDYIPLKLGEDNKGGIWKFRDITEQKNIDKRLKAQKDFYEHVLHTIPADIAVFDKEHRYLFVNKNGFKNDALREYMIGRTDEDYARYSNRPRSFVEKRFELYDSAVNSGKESRYVEKLINKEGKAGHHLRLLRPVFLEDGSFEFLMAYGLEITDLIEAQENLKTSIDTFSSAFDYSGIGMALIGTDGQWLDANTVLCDLTGYTKEELLKLTYHDITYPDDDEIDRPLIDQLLYKEIKTYTIEKRYVAKDKKVLLVSLTVSLVWNTDGTPKFFIAQVVDVTKRKELENILIRKNADLEAARESLINKIGQLEELSHIIAHNLRGPAGNVKMFADMLLTKHYGMPEPDNSMSTAFSIDDVVQFINESSTALTNSLATLMEITEIKLNKNIAYDDCDLMQIINEVKSQLYGVIFEKEAIIKTDLRERVVRYPRAYLENILYNFVSNALKYSRTDVQPEIIISVMTVAGRLELRVKDNGIGIDLDLYGGKVFKLNQVFHEGYDSKGIGLYITKTQVESLGGTITVKSRPNEGAEFIVTL